MVAAGTLPIAHATDGGGSIRIPAGVNGNIGLKVSRGVFSLAPHLSDLSGLVSIQGCQSRTVRDTAAFVDACASGARRLNAVLVSAGALHADDYARSGAAENRAVVPVGRVPRDAAYRADLRKVGRFLEGLAITSTTHFRSWTTAKPLRRRPPATSAILPSSSPTCWPRAAWRNRRKI